MKVTIPFVHEGEEVSARMVNAIIAALRQAIIQPDGSTGIRIIQTPAGTTLSVRQPARYLAVVQSGGITAWLRARRLRTAVQRRALPAQRGRQLHRRQHPGHHRLQLQLDIRRDSVRHLLLGRGGYRREFLGHRRGLRLTDGYLFPGRDRGTVLLRRRRHVLHRRLRVESDRRCRRGRLQRRDARGVVHDDRAGRVLHDLRAVVGHLYDHSHFRQPVLQHRPGGDGGQHLHYTGNLLHQYMRPELQRYPLYLHGHRHGQECHDGRHGRQRHDGRDHRLRHDHDDPGGAVAADRRQPGGHRRDQPQ